MTPTINDDNRTNTLLAALVPYEDGAEYWEMAVDSKSFYIVHRASSREPQVIYRLKWITNHRDCINVLKKMLINRGVKDESLMQHIDNEAIRMDLFFNKINGLPN